MKIIRFSFCDHVSGWQLKPVEFSPDLNLLVGVSGSGKTKILNALYSLKKVIQSEFSEQFQGIEWDIIFTTTDNHSYHWKGKFSLIPNKESTTQQGFNIIYEYLSKDDLEIISRDESKILFKKTEIPQLSPDKSVINLLNEPDINAVKHEFNQIVNSYPQSLSSNQINFSIYLKQIDNYRNRDFEDFRNLELDIGLKLAIIYYFFEDHFENIKRIYREIFPYVEDVKCTLSPFSKDRLVSEIEQDKQMRKQIEETVEESRIFLYFQGISITNHGHLQIKEKKVNDWISSISSGMTKTFMLISEIYLAPEGSVILIDEFENSLGVNCLDSVAELITDSHDRQFIITSHHPYIINNIRPEYWKIVTRDGSVVTLKTAEDYHISKSRPNAFIELMNVLEEEIENL